MKKIFDKDSIALGIVATLASELLCATLIMAVLLIIGIPINENPKWFIAAFVPPVLLLRHYAKAKEYPNTLKATITTVFVTLVAFMWVMVKYRYITFE